MAVPVKAVSTAIKIAAQIAADEEKRKKVLFLLLIPVILFFLLMGMILYFLSSPLEMLAQEWGWSEEKREKMEELKGKLTEFFPVEELAPEDVTKIGKYPFPIPGEFRVSSTFGWRTFWLSGKKVHDHHNGVDLVGQWHTPVISIADGVVVFSGIQRGYGNCIMIRHEEEGFYSFYAHLSQRKVLVDQKVQQYDVIGIEGGAKSDPGAGTSTGHHLHFEIRLDGTKKTVVNPMPYLTDEEKEDE